jgi:hypothetical protein
MNETKSSLASIKKIGEFRRDFNNGVKANIPDVLNRQTHVKRKISQSIDLASNSPIAAAAVFLRADGSIETTAIGIEPAVCMRFAKELDRLARTTRWHADRHRQSGATTLSILIPALLMAASYINTVPWLDSLICLLSHAFARWIDKRDRITN